MQFFIPETLCSMSVTGLHITQSPDMSYISGLCCFRADWQSAGWRSQVAAAAPGCCSSGYGDDGGGLERLDGVDVELEAFAVHVAVDTQGIDSAHT